MSLSLPPEGSAVNQTLGGNCGSEAVDRRGRPLTQNALTPISSSLSPEPSHGYPSPSHGGMDSRTAQDRLMVSASSWPLHLRVAVSCSPQGHPATSPPGTGLYHVRAEVCRACSSPSLMAASGQQPWSRRPHASSAYPCILYLPLYPVLCVHPHLLCLPCPAPAHTCQMTHDARYKRQRWCPITIHSQRD